MKCAQKFLPDLTSEGARDIIWFQICVSNKLENSNFGNWICQEQELFGSFGLLQCLKL